MRNDDQWSKPRRQPMQERSVARVARMLDTCAVLLDEVGYEALSTTLVAERAGVAIGSVYQFFPDKRGLVYALAHRNLDAYLRRLDCGCRIEDGAVAQDAAWFVRVAVDVYAQMHGKVRGFRLVRFGDDSILGLMPVSGIDQVVGRLIALLRQAGIPAPARLETVLTNALAAGFRIVERAFHHHAEGEDELIGAACDIAVSLLRIQAIPVPG